MNDNIHPRPALQPGLCHSARMTVATQHTVPQVAAWLGFADMPAVFATAMMVGFMEQTCIEALRPYLDAGQRSVGTHVDMSHVAATPMGMVVEARVELVEVQGKGPDVQGGVQRRRRTDWRRHSSPGHHRLETLRGTAGGQGCEESRVTQLEG